MECVTLSLFLFIFSSQLSNLREESVREKSMQTIDADEK